MGNIAMAVRIQREAGCETILHVCGRDRNLLATLAHLLGAHDLGLRNLVIITGDPPKMGDFPDATAVYDLDSIGILKLAAAPEPRRRPRRASRSAAATSFLLATGAEPAALNYPREIARLREKKAAGAELVMTQPVYDPDVLLRFLDDVAPLGLPVLVGLLPLASYRNAEFLHNEVPGMQVPEAVRERMRKAGSGAAARKEGVAIAREMLAAVRRASQARTSCRRSSATSWRSRWSTASSIDERGARRARSRSSRADGGVVVPRPGHREAVLLPSTAEPAAPAGRRRWRRRRSPRRAARPRDGAARCSRRRGDPLRRVGGPRERRSPRRRASRSERCVRATAGRVALGHARVGGRRGRAVGPRRILSATRRRRSRSSAATSVYAVGYVRPRAYRRDGDSPVASRARRVAAAFRAARSRALSSADGRLLISSDVALARAGPRVGALIVWDDEAARRGTASSARRRRAGPPRRRAARASGPQRRPPRDARTPPIRASRAHGGILADVARASPGAGGPACPCRGEIEAPSEERAYRWVEALALDGEGRARGHGAPADARHGPRRELRHRFPRRRARRRRGDDGGSGGRGGGRASSQIVWRPDGGARADPARAIRAWRRRLLRFLSARRAAGDRGCLFSMSTAITGILPLSAPSARPTGDAVPSREPSLRGTRVLGARPDAERFALATTDGPRWTLRWASCVR